MSVFTQPGCMATLIALPRRPNDISRSTELAAAEQRTEARKDSSNEKRDADYAVAKQKCDTYASEAKTLCLNRAKSEFGKS